VAVPLTGHQDLQTRFLFMGLDENCSVQKKCGHIYGTNCSIACIMDAIACIKECQDELRRATCHVLKQAAKCIDVDSGIFENLL
jgi:hypothetical protein